MRYGALPVVRETGGLADTVTNYDNADGDQGTGFVFLFEDPDAVRLTLRWAIDTYRRRRAAFERMQERAMRLDLGWGRAVEQYIALYEGALAKAGRSEADLAAIGRGRPR
jgi:starch synthase